MLKEEEIRKSPYYYRFAECDKEGNVVRVSVEDSLITKELVDYLTKHGYRVKERTEEVYTTSFVPSG